VASKVYFRNWLFSVRLEPGRKELACSVAARRIKNSKRSRISPKAGSPGKGGSDTKVKVCET
jgi:hypothetical protein